MRAAKNPHGAYLRLRARYFKPMGLTSWKPLVPEDEFVGAVSNALDMLMLPGSTADIGTYLEFGVSRGTSMSCVYRVLSQKGLGDTAIFGFDSFEGMPVDSVGQGWKPGQYHSTIGATRRFLAGRGVPLERVTLVKGWYEDTLTPELARRIDAGSTGLVMYDCDTYTSTRRALEFSLPLLADRAVLIFDDWGSRSDKNEAGQREAFQEVVLDRHKVRATPLPAYGRNPRMFLFERLDGADQPPSG